MISIRTAVYMCALQTDGSVCWWRMWHQKENCKDFNVNELGWGLSNGLILAPVEWFYLSSHLVCFVLQTRGISTALADYNLFANIVLFTLRSVWPKYLIETPSKPFSVFHKDVSLLTFAKPSWTLTYCFLTASLLSLRLTFRPRIILSFPQLIPERPCSNSRNLRQPFEG